MAERITQPVIGGQQDPLTGPGMAARCFLLPPGAKLELLARIDGGELVPVAEWTATAKEGCNASANAVLVVADDCGLDTLATPTPEPPQE